MIFFKCINISDDRRKYSEKIFEVLGIQLNVDIILTVYSYTELGRSDTVLFSNI